MTYTHLTINELTIIAHSFVQKLKAYRVAQMINRSAETVYRVYRYLETSASIADYQNHYTRNKQRCGRKRTQLPSAELTYIKAKVAQGWTPDTIIGRAERSISCNRRTLYRMFERGQFGFDVRSLPMRGKRIRMAMLSAAERLVNWGEVFMNARKTFRTMPLNLGTLKLIPSKAESIKGQ